MLLTKGFVGMAEALRRSLPEASKALAERGLAGKGRRQNPAVELRCRNNQAGSIHARVELELRRVFGTK